LSEAGYRVGLFTSPHLVRANERFRIGNREISDEELESILGVIASPSGVLRIGSTWQSPEPHDDMLLESLTFFELCTLIAFLYFAENKVDFAIFEVGLGGRLDATNVITPLLSVITEIGLDHTEILGPDISSIAREKAGIIKERIPIVCGASHPEARRVIEEVAKKKGSELSLIEVRSNGWRRDRPHSPASRPEAFRLDATRLMKFVKLPGLHQIHNAQIVLKVIEVLNGIVGALRPLHEEVIKKGFANVCWPGRMEWISKNPPILLDGAHNVEGVRALVGYLKLHPHPQPSPLEGEGVQRMGEGVIYWKVLFSAASDKNVGEMLKLLQEIASEIILCKMKHSRSVDPKNFSSYKSAHNSWEAFHQIKNSLRENEGLLVTGSLYLVGEIKRELLKDSLAQSSYSEVI